MRPLSCIPTGMHFSVTGETRMPLIRHLAQKPACLWKMLFQHICSGRSDPTAPTLSRTDRQLSVIRILCICSLHRIYYCYYTIFIPICQEVFSKFLDGCIPYFSRTAASPGKVTADTKNKRQNSPLHSSYCHIPLIFTNPLDKPPGMCYTIYILHTRRNI